MARNPKQDANLKPLTSDQSREKAVRNGRKGGKASGASRRALKTFKEVLMEGLTKEEQEVMLKALKRNAMRGNLPSMEFLLKMIGQHPDQTADDGNKEKTLIMKIEGLDDYAG